MVYSAQVPSAYKAVTSQMGEIIIVCSQVVAQLESHLALVNWT